MNAAAARELVSELDVEDHIAELVADAPPLSTAQLQALRLLLNESVLLDDHDLLWEVR